MTAKVIWIFALMALSVSAAPRRPHRVRPKDHVTLALPTGQCQAQIVADTTDDITLRLKKKTAACGNHGAIVRLARADIRRVTDGREESRQRDSVVGGCAAVAFLPTLGAALTVGEKHDAAVVPVLLGIPLAAELACAALMAHGSRYTIFAERITPVSP